MSPTDNTAVLVVGPPAMESQPSAQQDTDQAVSAPVTLPLATAAPVTTKPTTATSELPQSQAEAGVSPTDSAAVSVAGPSAVESQPYVQQDTDQTVSAPATLPLATAAPMTTEPTTATSELPQSQAEAGVSPTDSVAVLVVGPSAVESQPSAQQDTDQTASAPATLPLTTVAPMTLVLTTATSELPRLQADAVATTNDCATVSVMAGSKAVESRSSTQTTGKGGSGPVTRPLAIVAPSMLRSTLTTVPSKPQANTRTRTTGIAAALMVGQLATNTSVESRFSMQQGTGVRVGEPAGLSPSLPTAMPSTQQDARSVAAELSKPQPAAGSRATDCAILLMVEQLDNGRAVKSSVNLPAKRRLGLIPDVTTSVFAELDHWRIKMFVE